MKSVTRCQTGDLPSFFEHQRDPVAVAMVAFKSRDSEEFDAHWAKLMADDSNLKKSVLLGWMGLSGIRGIRVTRRSPSGVLGAKQRT